MVAGDDLIERVQRIADALADLRSKLDDMDVRLARMEDALYPVDPSAGWGTNGAASTAGGGLTGASAPTPRKS
jgi:hypothetical protein